MKVERSYVTCRVVEATEEEWVGLRDLLSYPEVTFAGGARRVKMVPMLDVRSARFPSGLLPKVAAWCVREGFLLEVRDLRAKPVEDLSVSWAWLRDYQRDAAEALLAAGNGIAQAPTASGKCWGPGVRVLRVDGTSVAVEDVRVGDALLGPDSQPRVVTSLARGRAPMYEIRPVKGDPWTCNGDHILVLVHTETGAVAELTVDMWRGRSDYWRHCHKLFQPRRVDFPVAQEPLPIDPYFLGVWFGDGRRDLQQGVQVSKPDPEILEACEAVAQVWGLEVRVDLYKSCPTYRLVARKGQPNPLLVAMRALVGDASRLPPTYLTAPFDARCELLAGLIDTDGHQASGFYEVVQERLGVADDLETLARSVGFRVTRRVKVVNGKSYHRLFILGDASHLPIRLPRKVQPPRKSKKDALRVGFTVAPLGEGDYYGFTVDGPDGRLLLSDYTVTHNTELACALMARVREPWLFVAHREELARQAGARFHDRTGEAPGFALAGEWAPARCTFATFATLTAALKSDKHQGRAEKLLSGVRGLIVDECHTLGARTHLRVVSEASRAFYRIGLSATPLGRTDGKSLHVIGYLGPVVWSRTSGEMADAGMTTPVEVTFIRCDQPGIAAGRDWNRARAYASVYRRGVVESEARNALLVRMAAACPRPWLLFVKRLDHAKRLTKALRDSGLRVGEATGKTPNRGGILDKLRFGEVDGVVCNVVFQEGVDVPALAGLVIGTGDKSGIAAIQRIGRGTRRADGKSTLTVFDVADGLPWVGDHAKERARTYKREGYALKLAEGVDAIRPAEEGTP